MTALWPHQRAAVEQLAPLKRGMLFMDMGTGKSRTALALIERWQCARVLILAPKSVVTVWPKEFSKAGFTSWRVCALSTGTVRDRADAMKTQALCAEVEGQPFCAVLNYDAVIHGDMPQALKGIAWDCIVLDEAHRLKASRGKQQKVVLDIVAQRGAVPHRLGLTGTPMPHSPLDVFAPFRIVNPNVFGWHYKPFEERHTVYSPERKRKDGQKFREILGYQHLDDLQARMAPHVYRVTSDEVLDLPDAVDVERYCLLEPKARRVYNDLEADLRAQIGAGEVTAANALSKLLRLAQVANGFASVVDGETYLSALQIIGSEKADLLREVLEDLPHDEPVVVFGRFHHDLDVIHEVAQGLKRRSCELSGRRNDLEPWQAPNGSPQVLAVQLKAGGLGVDLTRSRYQVYFALDYSLGDYLQTRKRIHRPGQTRNVTYIHLIAAGTVDERVYAALAARQEVVNSVLDGLGAVGMRRRAA